MAKNPFLDPEAFRTEEELEDWYDAQAEKQLKNISDDISYFDGERARAKAPMTVDALR